MTQAGTGLIYPALRKAGVTLGPGRMPSTAQMDDALAELQRLVGSLGIDPLFVYAQEILTFPLTAGKGSYTMGKDATGAVIADFDVARPSQITAAAILNNGMRHDIVIASPSMWAGITQSGQPGWPDVLYNDGAAPLATLSLWPVPSAAMDLELYVWHQAAALVSVNDVVQMPPGYDDAVVLNLAVRLAPQFQRPVDPQVRADARESLMRILSLNASKPILAIGGIGACGCSHYNIYSDS